MNDEQNNWDKGQNLRMFITQCVILSILVTILNKTFQIEFVNIFSIYVASLMILTITLMNVIIIFYNRNTCTH